MINPSTHRLFSMTASGSALLPRQALTRAYLGRTP
jgi:hypothetical protein